MLGLMAHLSSIQCTLYCHKIKKKQLLILLKYTMHGLYAEWGGHQITHQKAVILFMVEFIIILIL